MPHFVSANLFNFYFLSLLIGISMMGGKVFTRAPSGQYPCHGPESKRAQDWGGKPQDMPDGIGGIWIP